MMLAHFLWLTPFASFITGYLLLSLLSGTPALKTPAVVGQSLTRAAETLSQKKLNLRIVGHKDETDLAEGTIVSQTPAAGSAIKENQSLYLVIARTPNPLAVPDVRHKSLDEIPKFIESAGLHARIIGLPLHGPTATVIAQHPLPGMQAPDHQVLIYAAQRQKPVVMPNLKDKPLEEVLSFLELHGCTAELVPGPAVASPHGQKIVLDQRPVAGSLLIMSAEKPLKVQLQVG